ncbi:glutaminyl-peptide cyclotransferase [Phenylobacterium sp.]|uniref:glutaminyl-peptide cyclotransferase n=1 Tax=Phenylobacterium sp. TaxID=1871053 RepID=UPI00374CADFB
MPSILGRLVQALVGMGLLSATVAPPAVAAVPTGGLAIKHIYPHDTGAFTEGLFYLGGDLFESTGMPGRSDVRRVRLVDGVVLQAQPIAANLFGEGIVNWGGEILSLTWQDQIGFRWDLKALKPKTSFRYAGEGWALTQDGKHLIMSDGTPILRFRDPVTFKEVRHIQVTADGRPVPNLNELEWVKGEILANVWQTHLIARIDPVTGKVKAWIDLGSLPETQGGNPDAVLNGIAYDREHDRLFVTGKYWPHLYEIRLTPPKAGR